METAQLLRDTLEHVQYISGGLAVQNFGSAWFFASCTMHVLQPMAKASYKTVIKMLRELRWAARVTNQFATRGHVEGGGGRVAAKGLAEGAMHPMFQ